jgi:hypothetical protein
MIKTRRMRWMVCTMNGRDEKWEQNLLENLKRSHWKHRLRLEDNIKMEFKEIGSDIESCGSGYDPVVGRLNMIKNLYVPCINVNGVGAKVTLAL